MGGLATVERHGRDFMSKIGRRGAEKFWEKYTLQPFGTSDFVIVRRSDNAVVGTMSGNHIPHPAERERVFVGNDLPF